MKVIIDIDEELYNYIKSDNYDEHLDRRFDYKVRFAVKEGISLPKRYGDLYDCNDLSKLVGEDFRFFLSRLDLKSPQPIIESDGG